jgi:allophanate hydrolase
MSGLPLNGQLTELGGRLESAGKTAPVYRFYALPGGPPRRPGMVRVADGPGGGGGAVELEVWSLPAAAVGSFLRKIPAPLGLGTVTLADGSGVPGFLCESHATAGAEDITSLGGWRAYLKTLSV